MRLWFTRKERARTGNMSSTGDRLVYAVGDIHGRLDLLQDLIARVVADMRAAPGRPRASLVFLGDYIDRGPDTRGVIDEILMIQESGLFDVWALKGNHEASLLGFMGDPKLGPGWVEYGGAATLASYDVVTPAMKTDAAGWAAAQQKFIDVLPPSHAAFYAELGLTHVVGDYVFVHAGVRPGVALDEQVEQDLLWIRGDFLDAAHGFEQTIVHGHTPQSSPYAGSRRIGVDTGAYATGVLTAVRLLGVDRRFIQTASPPRISV